MIPTSMIPDSRRTFLRKGLHAATATALAPMAFPWVRAAETPILGHGDFRYRVVPGWGDLGASTPVNDCHGLAIDREGHVLLFTNETKNNVIVYDRKGRLVHKWGTQFPGAHGMSLVTEGTREVLYLTDLQRHQVFKTTLDGTILREWSLPKNTGKYPKEDEYRPSWTLHQTNGEFFVLDGYGRDYILHYGADGEFRRIFGGAEGGIVHWGPHGGMIDVSRSGESTLLIAMSDQQHLTRMTTDGRILGTTPLPGGNPRQIRRVGDHYFVAHLGDNWPKDRNCRGFVSVLDASLRVISNIGGTAPDHGPDGKLRPMAHREELFQHPHDLAVDREGSLYVAQFASGRTYPIKLERV
jgi:DNA-binding beta-propeller fold protein YncE